MNTHTSKWDLRFFDMAALVASWSKDPSTQVGAVIVRPDRTIASVGFNGFPKGMYDGEECYNDRDEKMSKIIHAEMNAMSFCKENMKGYTLYTFPFFTCDRCAVHVIQSGISTVISPRHFPDRWQQSLENALIYYNESGVKVFLI
jgi:dCMP deaminase